MFFNNDFMENRSGMLALLNECYPWQTPLQSDPFFQHKKIHFFVKNIILFCSVTLFSMKIAIISCYEEYTTFRQKPDVFPTTILYKSVAQHRLLNESYPWQTPLQTGPFFEHKKWTSNKKSIQAIWTSNKFRRQKLAINELENMIFCKFHKEGLHRDLPGFITY